MQELVFLIVSVVVILFCYAFNKNKIKNYLGENYKLYICLSIMFFSNLGFSSSIQYAMRLLGILISYFYILMYLKKGVNIKMNKIAFFIVLYLIFCLLSTFYSVSKIQTFLKVIEMFADIFLILLLYSMENNKDFVVKTINVVAFLSFALLVFNIIGFIVLPQYSSYSSKSLLGIRLNGFLGANKTSALSVICIIWVLLLSNAKSRYKAVILLVAFVSLFFSQSRSTLVLIPIIFFMKLYQPKARLKYFLIVFALIIIFINNIDIIQTYFLRGQTERNLAELTGRVKMWNASLKYINARPILGYGFGVGGELVAQKIYGISTMHSGIYETLLGTGIIGLSFLLLQYFYAVLRVISMVLKNGIKNNITDIILIVYFSIRSYTSLGIGNWHSQELIIWYLFIIIISTTKSIQQTFNTKGDL